MDTETLASTYLTNWSHAFGNETRAIRWTAQELDLTETEVMEALDEHYGI